MTLCCDIDGVLAQFVRATLALHNSPLSHADVKGWGFYEQLGVTEAAMYEPMGYSFWASLPTYADGMELLDLLLATGERTCLLSSPVETLGCVDGKRAWVKRHLPGMAKATFIGSDKSVFANPQTILIDDSDSNVEKFRLVGGLAVLVPRPWNKARVFTDSTGHFNPRRLFSEEIAPRL